MIDTILIDTAGKGLIDITVEISASVSRAIPGNGLVTIFIQHTSASLIIQENADPAVGRDLDAWLSLLVSENDPLYSHTREGPDDMPAHIRSALTQTSISIPVMSGAMCLGAWQGIYLWEHRHRPHRRQIVLHLYTDS